MMMCLATPNPADHRDPPPEFGPDDLPSPEKMSRLANELLREMAQDDPELAQRLCHLGIITVEELPTP